MSVGSLFSAVASTGLSIGKGRAEMREGLARSWDGGTEVAAKKRRNPWGDSSYADLITQAIEASPEQRLTLSQIYDWIVRNVPYFRDQGDTSSSAGWKNSIRHNLSLYTKFKAIKNEPNRSSWWIISDNASESRTTRRKKRSKSKVKKKQNFFGRLPSTLNAPSDRRTEISPPKNLYPITNVDRSKRNTGFFETTCHIDLYKSDVGMPMEEYNTDNRWFSKSLFKSPHHLSFSYVTTEIEANMLQDNISAGGKETFNRFEMSSFTKGLEGFSSFAYKLPMQTVSETYNQNQLAADHRNYGSTQVQRGSLRELIDELMKELNEITNDESQSSSTEFNDNLCTLKSTTSSDVRPPNTLPHADNELLHFNSDFVQMTTPFDDNSAKELDRLNSNNECSTEKAYHEDVYVSQSSNFASTESTNLARMRHNEQDDENVDYTSVYLEKGNNECLLDGQQEMGSPALNVNSASYFFKMCGLRSVHDYNERQSNSDESSSDPNILQTERESFCKYDCNVNQSNPDESSSESFTFKTENTITSFKALQSERESKTDESFRIRSMKFENETDESLRSQHQDHEDKADISFFEVSSLQPVNLTINSNLKLEFKKDCTSSSDVEHLSLEFMNLKEIDDDSLSNYLDCVSGFENYDSDFDVYLQS
ncbi:uncharacterized protein LOC129216463 [Uloborus diversus]|uniref:uncharacterized protein LOC129216463 n=1 Tax=Uloborus diversus TaxID=327109 RepID=UPI00240919FB|nr:uncharacterized protein LOC129216463 [Uloborus diversus]